MRAITANWFETSVRYERQTDEGMQKMVTETYVVDAFTFGEAEEAITKEMTAYVTGEFSVKNITPAAYGEIFFSDGEDDDKWYKAKLVFPIQDEKTGKEKRTTTTFLVQANSFSGALKNVEQVMNTGTDYVIANISETKIMDVYEHQARTKKVQRDDKPEYEAADDAAKEAK
ncbi:MAG: DUF4494 domain-containing protein [Prevotella sp.]|nr:DUF4494 domain-containing protein [Prevotella sp.]